MIHKIDKKIDTIIQTNNNNNDNNQAKILNLQIIYYLRKYNTLKIY